MTRLSTFRFLAVIAVAFLVGCDSLHRRPTDEGAAVVRFSRISRIAAIKEHPRRYDAIDQLGQQYTKRASVPLVQIMQDDDIVVRRHAAVSLGQLAMGMYLEQQVVRDLHGLLMDESYSTRDLAAYVLGRHGTSESVVLLASVVANADQQLFSVALDALHLAFSGVLMYNHPDLDRPREVSTSAGDSVIDLLTAAMDVKTDRGASEEIKKVIHDIEGNKRKTWGREQLPGREKPSD